MLLQTDSLRLSTVLTQGVIKEYEIHESVIFVVLLQDLLEERFRSVEILDVFVDSRFGFLQT